MSNRPTPETNASCWREGFGVNSECVHAEFARKLERERDEAREELHDIRLNLGEDADGYTLLHAVCVIQNERDEAREALDRISHPVWWMQEDQKRKTGSINGICGGMAIALSEDAEYLKGIAKSALNRGTK